MPVRAAIGDEPGTGTTSEKTRLHWHAHGLCRNCGKPIRVNEDCFWVHQAGVLCEGLFCAAEPIGIDMPGVGVVRPGQSSPAELRPGRESAGDEVSRDGDLVGGAELRERLFAQLIFAARDLAQEQIEPATEHESAFCTECGVDEHRGVIAHEPPSCRTGRVLELLVELTGTLNLKLDQKEAATDEEAHAGDGTRPRGLEKFKGVIKDLGDLAGKAHPGSAMLGYLGGARLE